MNTDRRPEILIVTDWPINKAHGTGSCLVHIFADYPQHLLSNCFLKQCQRGELAFKNAYACEIIGGAIGLPLDTHRPDIVYSLVSTLEGFRLLEALIGMLPANTPIVQHSVDLYPASGPKADTFWQVLTSLKPSISAFWALTESIAHTLSQRLGKDVAQQPIFTGATADAIAHRYTVHAKCGVISGNFWTTNLAETVATLWTRAMAQDSSLPPLHWYCHANGLDRLGDFRRFIGSSIIYAGFIESYEALIRRMSAYDFALLPFFNGDAGIEQGRQLISTDYARYSLPSRIADYCSAGLPIFAIAPNRVETSQFIRRHGIGSTAATGDGDSLDDQLYRFRTETNALDEFSKAAADLAFEFAPKSRQQTLINAFNRLIDAQGCQRTT